MVFRLLSIFRHSIIADQCKINWNLLNIKKPVSNCFDETNSIFHEVSVDLYSIINKEEKPATLLELAKVWTHLYGYITDEYADMIKELCRCLEGTVPVLLYFDYDMTNVLIKFIFYPGTHIVTVSKKDYNHILHSSDSIDLNDILRKIIEDDIWDKTIFL